MSSAGYRPRWRFATDPVSCINAVNLAELLHGIVSIGPALHCLLIVLETARQFGTISSSFFWGITSWIGAELQWWRATACQQLRMSTDLVGNVAANCRTTAQMECIDDTSSYWDSMVFAPKQCWCRTSQYKIHGCISPWVERQLGVVDKFNLIV